MHSYTHYVEFENTAGSQLDLYNLKDNHLVWTFSTEHLPSKQPLNRILTQRGLLTVALEQVFGDEISIQLLPGSAPGRGDRLRCAIIKCGIKPMVYAETLMPWKTLCRHSWLVDLGAQPLGARMSEYGNVLRSAYAYCQLAPSDHIYQRVIENTGTCFDACANLWARRYSLSLDSHAVRITEVFLPTVETEQ